MTEDPEILNSFNRKSITDRQTSELLGFARGIIADGVVSQAEIEALQKWLVANEFVVDHPMIGALRRQVDEILADGILDVEEAALMYGTLKDFCADDYELGEEQKSSRLPLCKPPPVIIHEGKSFCFTGTFSFGGKRECQEAVEQRNGIFSKTVTKKLDYLVVGEYVTESWKFSNYGTKVEKAVLYRDDGAPIRIVSEMHWRAHL